MVIIECPNCDTQYNYDESRFEGKPSKKIRCGKCKTVFEVFNPELEGEAPRSTPSTATPAAAPTASPTPSAPASDDPHDETKVGKVKKKKEDYPTEETGTHSFTPELSMPENLRLSLAITDGPGSAQIFRIEKPSVTIGRTGADVVLSDPEASRRHALLAVRDGHFFVSDMGSRNGTWIEGQKVEGEAEIHNQTEFRVGATTLMLIVTPVE